MYCVVPTLGEYIKLMALYGTMTAPYFSPSTSSNPIEYVVFKSALMIKGQVRGAEFWMKPLDVKTGLPYGQKRRANKRVSF